MVKISLKINGFRKDNWKYVVTLNNLVYTTCDTLRDAEREAKTLLRDLRFGRA